MKNNFFNAPSLLDDVRNGTIEQAEKNDKSRTKIETYMKNGGNFLIILGTAVFALFTGFALNGAFFLPIVGSLFVGGFAATSVGLDLEARRNQRQSDGIRQTLFFLIKEGKAKDKEMDQLKSQVVELQGKVDQFQNKDQSKGAKKPVWENKVSKQRQEKESRLASKAVTH